MRGSNPPWEGEVQVQHPGKGRLGPAVPPNAQLAHGSSSSAGIRGGQCVRDTGKRLTPEHRAAG